MLIGGQMLKKAYFLFLLIISPTLFSASFDCTKASTDVEKIICNTSYISDLDIRLGNEYRLLMSSDISSNIKNELLRSQREWLIDRNKCVDADCLSEQYTYRISQLCIYSFNFGLNPNCHAILDIEISNMESIVTKSEFREQKIDILNSHKEISDDPLKAKMALCYLDIIIDNIFDNSDLINKDLAEDQFEDLNSSSEMDQLIQLKIVRCLLNSDEFLQSIYEQSLQDGTSNLSSDISKLPLMDFEDLLLDISILNGKKVRVMGNGNYIMDTFMLKKETIDMNFIIINIDNLPREKRREILQSCSDIAYPCEITVTGVVKSGDYNFMNEIIAEDIEW